MRAPPLPPYKLHKNFESQNKVSRYFCGYFRKWITRKLKMLSFKLVSNRAMEDPLIIVHRLLRSHLIRKHTTLTTPVPKSLTMALLPTPNSPPGHQENDKRPSFTFLVPQQKVQSGGKPYPGTPEGRNSKK